MVGETESVARGPDGADEGTGLVLHLREQVPPGLLAEGLVQQVHRVAEGAGADQSSAATSSKDPATRLTTKCTLAGYHCRFLTEKHCH